MKMLNFTHPTAPFANLLFFGTAFELRFIDKMKPMKRSLFLYMIILFSTFSAAQNLNYQDLWTKVETFEIDGLPKSALKLVNTIEKQALKDGNHPQLIKTMLFKSKYTLILEEDAQLSIINDFKTKIEAT